MEEQVTGQVVDVADNGDAQAMETLVAQSGNWRDVLEGLAEEGRISFKDALGLAKLSSYGAFVDHVHAQALSGVQKPPEGAFVEWDKSNVDILAKKAQRDGLLAQVKALDLSIVVAEGLRNNYAPKVDTAPINTVLYQHGLISDVGAKTTLEVVVGADGTHDYALTVKSAGQPGATTDAPMDGEVIIHDGAEYTSVKALCLSKGIDITGVTKTGKPKKTTWAREAKAHGLVWEVKAKSA